MKFFKYKLAAGVAVMHLMALNSGYGAIMSGEERVKQMQAVRAVMDLDVRIIEPDLLAKAPSPFKPDLGIAEIEGKEEEIALTDEELLVALSDYINPTGIFLFGGEFYLIFNERKMKAGSSFGIMYEGVEYSVTIAEITGSTYTVKRGVAALQLKLK